MMRALATCCMLATSTVAGAQVATFQEGDIYYISNAYPFPSSGEGHAIVGVDPHTDAQTIINSSLAHFGRGAYDPFRQRLVLAGLTGSDSLVAIDPNGSPSTLIPSGQAPVDLVAPTGDSRIYYWGGNVFGYLDVHNNQHPLLSFNGVSQMIFFFVSAMIYDRPTNSIIIAETSSPSVISLRRLNLNDAGTQALDLDLTRVNLHSGPTEVVSLAPGPNGTIYVQVVDQSNSLLPRALLLDPVTMTTTPFAYTGDRDVSGDIAGAYSSVNNRAYVADTQSGVLRTYAQNDSGAGTQLAGSISGGFSGIERAQLIEIPGWEGELTDYTLDGITDAADLGLLLANWGNPGATDLNRDGTTNGSDLGLLLANWGATSPTRSKPIPRSSGAASHVLLGSAPSSAGERRKQREERRRERRERRFRAWR
ncbi:MAG: hypothetical protein ACF8GE_10480 [Phycisphaerales bacterium JB043]